MVRTIFIEGKYSEKVLLSNDMLNYLKGKKYHTLGLFASVQFCQQFDSVKQQLEKLSIKAATSTAKRCAVEGQLLGCDCSSDALNLNKDVDAFLYIVDGNFHPLALAYGQNWNNVFKEIICYNPKSNQFTVLSKKDVETNLKRYKGALTKFHSTGNIGVIISLKPGQEFYKKSLELEKKYTDKKFYYFVDNEVSFGQLENFNFIDVWVNTACPRIALDDSEMFRKGVVNLKEVLRAEVF